MRLRRRAGVPRLDDLRIRLEPVAVDAASDPRAVRHVGVFDVVVVSVNAPEDVLDYRSMGADLGVDEQELWGRAARQTAESVLPRLDVRDHSLGAGRSCRSAASDDSWFVTFLMLMPHLLEVPDLPGGALWAAPSHDGVVVLPLRRKGDLEALLVMSDLARSMWRDSRLPCSPEVVWWCPHVGFTRVATREFATSVRVTGPPELLTAMESLSD